METDENALGGAAVYACGTGDCFGRGHRWSRATIFMMLKRLIAKGAVTMDDSGKFQKYSAAITYSDVEPEETESFLSKVYGGSVGMMVSNLVGRGALSEQEIQELKAILDAAETRED